MKFVTKLGCMLLAFLTVNLVYMFYDHDGTWYRRDGGATSGIYRPGSYISNMKEGIGFRVADQNGYLNKSSALSDKAIIVYGKSHTNALEVPDGKRYVSLLNEKMSSGDMVKVYSVARGGNSFADMICGFHALVEEFDNASSIIMEITEVGDLQDIENALVQRTYTDADTVPYLEKHQSIPRKGLSFVKEYLPLFAAILNKVDVNKLLPQSTLMNAGDIVQKWIPNIDNSNQKDNHNEFVRQERTVEQPVLEQAMSLIRSQYEGRIIIFYHPEISIVSADELCVYRMDNYDELKMACEHHDIYFCDMSDVFRKSYQNDHCVPYGFWNTRMGTGHLNAEGHKMIADTLYENFFKE